MKYSFVIYLILILQQVTLCASEEDFFKVLGITKRARKNEIKRAYRSISKKVHPDKNKCDPRASEKFYLLKEAFDTLSDEDRRYLYRQRNPHYGQVKVEYDWDLPHCSNETQYGDREWWFPSVSTESGIWRLASVFMKPLTLTHYVIGITYQLLTTSFFTSAALGATMYLSAYILCRNAVYQFLLLFVIVEGLIHFFLILKTSQTLPSIFASWQITAIALFLVWTCYIAALLNLVDIVLYGISVRNLLFLQHYLPYLIMYTVGSFCVTMYYYWKYPLHRYQRHVLACQYLQQALGILLIYSAVEDRQTAVVICVAFILCTWCISKLAPYVMRACIYVLKKIFYTVIIMLKVSCRTVVRFIVYIFHILLRILRLLYWPAVTIMELPLTLPAVVVKFVMHMWKVTLQSLQRGILIVYHFIGSKIFPLSFSLSCPPHHSKRLLSTVEYILEGRAETRRQLNELRRVCQTRDYNVWKTAGSLQNLARFTRFVHGEDHITEEEREEHSRHGNQYPLATGQDEDVSDEDVSDED